MTKNVRHILILDRSGSMNDLADPGSQQTKAMVATAGIKNYIEEQKGYGVLFTVWEFDSVGNDIHITRIADAVPAPSWTCNARGGTPLLDAVGTVLQKETADISALPKDQQPSRVFVLISTDGLENTSRDWSKSSVRRVMADRTDAGWDIIFIGADIDAFAEAGGIGARAGSVISTNTVNAGAYASSFKVSSSAVTRARAGGQSVAYTTEERSLAEQGGE